MSTLDSWIDREELGQLLAGLTPNDQPAEPVTESEKEAVESETEPQDLSDSTPESSPETVEETAPEVDSTSDETVSENETPDEAPVPPVEIVQEVETYAQDEIPNAEIPPAQTQDDAPMEFPPVEEVAPVEEFQPIQEPAPAQVEEPAPEPVPDEVPVTQSEEVSIAPQETPILDEEPETATDISHGSEVVETTSLPAPTEELAMPEPASMEPEIPAEENQPIIENEPGEFSNEPVIENDPPLDFDQPQAYEAAPFPTLDSVEPEQELPEPPPVSSIRRTAAVQAAEALERARDQAQSGGLLRPLNATDFANLPPKQEAAVEEPAPPASPPPAPAPFTPLNETVEQPADFSEPEPEPTEAVSDEPSFEGEDPWNTPLMESEPVPGFPPEPLPEPQEPIQEAPPTFDTKEEEPPQEAFPSFEEDEPIFGSPEPESFPTDAPVSFEDSEEQPEEENAEAIATPFANVEDVPPPTGSLRGRLTAFADRVTAATGTNTVTITDFQSYPLLPQAEMPTGVHSALRLAHWCGLLTVELQKTRDGFTQIALAEGWLCVVAADSAAGGVCASFRVSDRIDDDSARKICTDLRETLGEPPQVDSPPALSQVG